MNNSDNSFSMLWKVPSKCIVTYDIDYVHCYPMQVFFIDGKYTGTQPDGGEAEFRKFLFDHTMSQLAINEPWFPRDLHKYTDLPFEFYKDGEARRTKVVARGMVFVGQCTGRGPILAANEMLGQRSAMCMLGSLVATLHDRQYYESTKDSAVAHIKRCLSFLRDCRMLKDYSFELKEKCFNVTISLVHNNSRVPLTFVFVEGRLRCATQEVMNLLAFYYDDTVRELYQKTDIDPGTRYVPRVGDQTESAQVEIVHTYQEQGQEKVVYASHDNQVRSESMLDSFRNNYVRWVI